MKRDSLLHKTGLSMHLLNSHYSKVGLEAGRLVQIPTQKYDIVCKSRAQTMWSQCWRGLGLLYSVCPTVTGMQTPATVRPLPGTPGQPNGHLEWVLAPMYFWSSPCDSNLPWIQINDKSNREVCRLRVFWLLMWFLYLLSEYKFCLLLFPEKRKWSM